MQTFPEKQTPISSDIQVSEPAASWIDNAEIFSVVLSIGGAVASAVMQQVAVAAIPLSFTAALNLANRRRLINAVVESQKTVTAQLVAQDQQQQQSQAQQSELFETETKTVQQRFSEMQSLSDTFSRQLDELGTKGNDLETVLDKLREIERCTHAIRNNPRSAEFFLNRGEVRQSLSRVEDNRLAIDDYTQAIELDSLMAKAYFNRGVLRAELEERRAAGEDLRMAAKCYFDQGDMDNYAEAKQLSEQIYEKFEQRDADLEKSDKLRATNLFA